MGDNRPGSIDSRSDQIGAICLNDVIGRALLAYWPVDKMGILQAPRYGAVPTATPPAVPAGSTASPAGSAPTTGGVERLRVEVIGRRPHDVTSYTEGLVLVGGRMYESSGYAPTLREVDPQSGALLRSVTMDGRYSGEGIAVVDDHLVQLTL